MNVKTIASKLDAAMQLILAAKAELTPTQEPAKSTPEKAASLGEEGKCTICQKLLESDPKKPDKLKQIRGACPACHKKVNRLLVEGTITDEEAVKRGWLREAKKGGRPFSPGSPGYQLMQEQYESKQRKKR